MADIEDLSMLGRIDERTKNIDKELQEVKHRLDYNFVTRDEFAPIKALVYGMVAIVMTSVVGGLLVLLFTRQH